jgi:hypothetical protein
LKAESDALFSALGRISLFVRTVFLNHDSNRMG